MEIINNTTLVIMAAGIGSRFENGIKQLAPINDKGETIMELSIKNAEKVGFNKVVFIIRKELQKYFDENIIPKINLKYEYAYQEIDSKRSKPWGTGHALLSIKNIVKENFCLINSDDYYSYDSFEKVYKYLNNNSNVMVGYKLKNTIFVDKGVNRGICHIKDNKLVNIEETLNIRKINNKFISDKELNENSIVSMNVWGFKPDILNYFEEEFNLFLKNIKDYEKDEFYIGTVINKLINENKIDIYVVDTDSKCIGITYSEDVELFNDIIKD